MGSSNVGVTCGEIGAGEGGAAGVPRGVGGMGAATGVGLLLGARNENAGVTSCSRTGWFRHRRRRAGGCCSTISAVTVTGERKSTGSRGLRENESATIPGRPTFVGDVEFCSAERTSADLDVIQVRSAV